MSATGIVYEVDADTAPTIGWKAIIAGAVTAAGISVTLLAFGSAIGLSVVSTAPSWRDSSPLLWFLSGLFLVFVALAAFGFGGYVTGRMRARVQPASTEEGEFRDGMHGIITWALAVLMAAVLAAAGAGVIASATGTSDSTTGAVASVAGENLLASELDELFRSQRVEPDATYRRAEAARILLKSSSHDGIPVSDRDYLANLVGYMAGLNAAEADARVDDVIAKSTQELRSAREAAVLQAFLIGAALLMGAAVAWFAACEGGRDREESAMPIWDWRWRRTRSVV